MVILVLAFIVLGPQRMIDAARLIGKATSELRRMSQGLTDVLEEPMEEPRVERPGGDADAGQSGDRGGTDAADSPVGFRSPRRGDTNDDGERSRP